MSSANANEQPAANDPSFDAAAEKAKGTTASANKAEMIFEAAPEDVLSGRGASVNNHPGNKRFRALCFVRKPLFDRGNHAAKRRIATEIVRLMTHPTEPNMAPSRFLKKTSDKASPYFLMTEEQAISKAQQVMRDYKRPDRIAMRMNLEATGQLRRRNRTTVSTPLEEAEALPVDLPEGPIIENPFGVHEHDVLCGRGAFVNGHIGNGRLRKLSLERKETFDKGNFTDKRSLAMEIYRHIQGLNPPGRFLKKAGPNSEVPASELIDGMWEQLSEEKAIHKTCQVMRDIARPDRKHREERKEQRKRAKQAKSNEKGGTVTIQIGQPPKQEEEIKDEATLAAEQAAVEVVDKALASTEQIGV